MTKSLYATFDGCVLIPEEELNALPNQRYRIIIETEPEGKPQTKGALNRIASRAKDLGLSDLALQHDHYLYGTEKQ